MSEYYDKWYQENKERIAAKRKGMYANDPEYRAKVIERSKRYRNAKRDKRRNLAPPSAMRSMRRAITETVNGRDVVFYPIGVLAAAVNRSPQCVAGWSANGVIPVTPYRRGHHRSRLYTMDMIDAVRDVIGNRKRLFPADPSIPIAIEEMWRASGVPVDFDGDFEEALKMTSNAEASDD